MNSESSRDANDAPLDLASMAELMRTQQRATRGTEARLISLMLLTWGIAWLVAFLALWSGERGGNWWFRLPSPVEWIVFAAAIGVSIIVSTVIGVRMGRGTRGASATSGAMYGWSWPIAMIGAWLVLMGFIRQGMPPETTSVVAPALFILIAGAIFLVGGALWRNRMTFLLGASVIAITAAASLMGSPHHLLLYGLGAGGVLIAFAAFTWFEVMGGTAPDARRGTAS